MRNPNFVLTMSGEKLSELKLMIILYSQDTFYNNPPICVLFRLRSRDFYYFHPLLDLIKRENHYIFIFLNDY
jgi:hypothetical protein